MSTVFLGIWRAFAVPFFCLIALLEHIITIPLLPRAKRLHGRTEWLHRWSRFASQVVGIRVTTNGSMPRSGLLVCNHLSYLDVIVLSSIQPCVFVAKRDVAAWPLFGWLARAAGTISSIARIDSPAQQWSILSATRSLTALLSCFFPKAQVLMAWRYCRASRHCSSPLYNFAVRSQPRPSSTSSMTVRSQTRCAIGGTHLLNLFFKREIRANYSFSLGRIRAGNRKEIARELRDEIVSIRS
jgi:1-acyl-sn-glycerol-3-phosphate acyltransferase